jgi:mannosyl-3-phosphoglycerate phosphatase family protein
MPSLSSNLVLFTDLDGTFLEFESYRSNTAQCMLELLYQRSIPVVICSSKSRMEVESLHYDLQNDAPFIVENGAALYLPAGYFKKMPPKSFRRNGYDVLEFGRPYLEMRRALRTIEQQVGTNLIGFGDMSVHDLMRVTGLSYWQAEQALQREYDEPFFIADLEMPLERIEKAAAELGLAVVPGGRFYHLTSSDKGRACRAVIALYREDRGCTWTAGIGDDLNDLPMLAAIDCPYLLQQKGGGYADAGCIHGLIRIDEEGPIGWAEAVALLLRRTHRPSSKTRVAK